MRTYIVMITLAMSACSSSTPSLQSIESDCVRAWNSDPKPVAPLAPDYATVEPIFEDDYASCAVTFFGLDGSCVMHWGAVGEFFDRMSMCDGPIDQPSVIEYQFDDELRLRK